MIYTFLAFIVILGILVFVHELGHFLTARFFGVKAEEFGLGFPPRIFGLVFNKKKRKWEFIKGGKEIKRKNTIYSLNWIPIGGFVKILGEDGENDIKHKVKEKSKSKDRGKDKIVSNQAIKIDAKRDPDNFLSKTPFQKIVILSAGVVMNFLLAVFILSVGFFTGLPEEVEEGKNYRNAKVIVVDVLSNSPAKEMGITPGDELKKITAQGKTISIAEVKEVIDTINQNKGKEIIVEAKRGNDIYRFKGVPRLKYPKGEGALGIGLTKTALVSHSLRESLKLGFLDSVHITKEMFKALFVLLRNLITGKKVDADVTGVVGIVVLTNQAVEMGFAYLIRFTALLSINLAIINILPIPALDGGRILFIILEKIKRKPLSPNLEGKFHAAGMYALLSLMFLVTVRDIFRFQDKFEVLWDKVKGIF